MAQPHWNAAVRTPYAAPIDSRFITAAFSGTTTERNIIDSSSTETPTTKPITSQIRPESRSAMSANIGVVPVSSAPSGRTSERSESTSPAMRSSVGPKAGSASKTASAPSGEVLGGKTVATPGWSATSAAIRSTAEAPRRSRSTTTVIGPLAPGPNSSATRS